MGSSLQRVPELEGWDDHTLEVHKIPPQALAVILNLSDAATL